MMTLLVGLGLLVFAASATAESLMARGSDAAVVARAHVDIKIIIPEVLYLDANAGTWRTNARRTEAVIVTVMEGRPDRLAMLARRTGNLTHGVVRATSYAVAMP